LLKHLGINGIVDGVESYCITLLVGLVLVCEIIGINNSILTLGHIPHLIIDWTKIQLHLSLSIIIACAIKEWWFAPHMVEHNLSHNLTPRFVTPLVLW
jgi:hypothetical protein